MSVRVVFISLVYACSFLPVQNLEVIVDDDKLSDVVPSNIVSRQVIPTACRSKYSSDDLP